MTRPGVPAFVLRLARAAPGAFRHDPLFRTAAIGTVLALLIVLARLGGRDGVVPGPPPPPAVLSTSYGDRDIAPPSPPTTPVPPATEPIRPSRSLDGVTVRRDSTIPADRFGTLGSPQLQPETPDAHP